MFIRLFIYVCCIFSFHSTDMVRGALLPFLHGPPFGMFDNLRLRPLAMDILLCITRLSWEKLWSNTIPYLSLNIVMLQQDHTVPNQVTIPSLMDLTLFCHILPWIDFMGKTCWKNPWKKKQSMPPRLNLGHNLFGDAGLHAISKVPWSGSLSSARRLAWENYGESLCFVDVVRLYQNVFFQLEWFASWIYQFCADSSLLDDSFFFRSWPWVSYNCWTFQI